MTDENKAEGLSAFQIDAMNRARESTKAKNGEPTIVELHAGLELAMVYREMIARNPANRGDVTVAAIIAALQYGAELRTLGLI